jgi:uridylate kinase
VGKKFFLKLSGELLSGEGKKGYLNESADLLAEQLSRIITDTDARLAIVLGGGNIFRGRDRYGSLGKTTTDYSADYMGIASTLINAIGLTDLLKNKYSVKTKIFSTPVFPPITVEFNPNESDNYFADYQVLIFAGGIGQPGFTTDTCAVLKAKQLGFDKIFKGTKVDGIYDKDPKSYPDAKKINKISYEEAISSNIKVMDMAAFGLAKESNMDIVIFKADGKNGILSILEDETRGSIVTGRK